MARAGRIPTASRLVWEEKDGGLVRRPDQLAAEEPLEIRAIRSADRPGLDDGTARTLSITMRTPGNDFELAAGWLLAEGVVDGLGDLHGVRYCTDPRVDVEQRYNVVTADLRSAAADRLESVEGTAARLTVTSSSCGVCGTASIDALRSLGHPPLTDAGAPGTPGSVPLAAVVSWPDQLRTAQAAFDATGGLHAAGLVDLESNELLVAREDIGRHNAVDKVIGWALLRGQVPLGACGLVVSGRTSFEIVQKALRAGVPVVAAVSAASGLAARLAEEEGLTLLGFVRGGRATIYSHPERLVVGGGSAGSPSAR